MKPIPKRTRRLDNVRVYCTGERYISYGIIHLRRFYKYHVLFSNCISVFVRVQKRRETALFLPLIASIRETKQKVPELGALNNTLQIVNL